VWQVGSNDVTDASRAALLHSKDAIKAANQTSFIAADSSADQAAGASSLQVCRKNKAPPRYCARQRHALPWERPQSRQLAL
jgi:hypothetical protein